jgi:hypothetical protein
MKLPLPVTDETIRDWSKKVLHDWAAHLVGEGGWDERGAAHPDGIIDCIFSQIQVTLLGYADDMQEAEAKREAIDRMLRIRGNK